MTGLLQFRSSESDAYPMIRYDLICDRGHEFEGWYRDSVAFDGLNADGHIECPVCGSAKIAKQLMAPRLPAKSNRKKKGGQQPVYSGPQGPEQRALLEAMRKVRKHVEETADYVGEKFPEEARKMHYGEAEERGIYGEASEVEAKELVDEGIQVSPLPKLPEDRN